MKLEYTAVCHGSTFMDITPKWGSTAFQLLACLYFGILFNGASLLAQLGS